MAGAQDMILIETDELAAFYAAKIGNHNRIAIDFEGEWNLHRYGLHLCLIQISDGEANYLFDPLKIKELRPIWDILENPKILKISHGPQSDLVLLDYRYDVHPRNIFDTEKAAQLLGYESTSLSGLLELHHGIQKNTKVRASNWNIRPLTQKMLEYAAMDVEYLLDVHLRLLDELKEKGRLAWQEEENIRLEDIRHREKEDPHLEIKGAEKLTRRQMAILKFIYEARDKIAEKYDKPAYHIISNQLLIGLSENPPISIEDWRELKGVNPRVRIYAQDFFEAVKKGKALPLEDNIKKVYDDRMGRKEWFDRVNLIKDTLDILRKKIEEDHEMSHLILSSRTVKRIAYGEFTFEDLRKWQREILLEKAEEIGMDLAFLEE